MAKDPAFLFYPGDYLRDTQCLSEKAQVAYDRIMCEHMRNLLISDKQLIFFTKRLSDDEKEDLLMTLSKVDGGYQISWVADSIVKRKAFTESRRNSRLKSDEDNVRIYIVRDNVRTTYKIGSSVNPIRRYNELSNQVNPAIMADEQHNRSLTLVWYSHPTLRVEEKKLHKKFISKHLQGEWFNLSTEDLDYIYRSYSGTYVDRTENAIENDNAIEKDEVWGMGKEETIGLSPSGFFLDTIDPSMPLNSMQVGATIEYIRIKTKLVMNISEVNEQWQAFKIQNFGQHTWYNSLEKLLSHFRNSLKLENRTNGTHQQSFKKPANGKSAGAEELAASLEKQLSVYRTGGE